MPKTIPKAKGIEAATRINGSCRQGLKDLGCCQLAWLCRFGCALSHVKTPSIRQGPEGLARFLSANPLCWNSNSHRLEPLGV